MKFERERESVIVIWICLELSLLGDTTRETEKNHKNHQSLNGFFTYLQRIPGIPQVPSPQSDCPTQAPRIGSNSGWTFPRNEAAPGNNTKGINSYSAVD